VAAVARVDPAALAVMAVTVLVPVLPALVAAAARVVRPLLLAQQEHLPLAVLVAQGGLQALEVPEVQFLYPLPSVQTAAAAAAGLILKLVLRVLPFR